MTHDLLRIALVTVALAVGFAVLRTTTKER
jgi:hypothetical protein